MGNGEKIEEFQNSDYIRMLQIEIRVRNWRMRKEATRLDLILGFHENSRRAKRIKQSFDVHNLGQNVSWKKN